MGLIKYKIYLPGGIGCQILHLLIGIEKAIKKGIDPKDIEVFICKYQNNESDRLFHNAEDILNYIDFNKQITIKVTFKKPLKKFKLNKENARKIVFSLCHNYKKYFKVQIFNFSFNLKFGNIIWIRGLDRKFNIKKIEYIAREKYIKNNFAVVSNDINNLKKSNFLYSRKTGGTSLLNFECLIKSNSILTQLSGFSLAPFLLNDKKQKIFLLSKKYHSKKEFPTLDEDWEFIETLLKELHNNNRNKVYEIID